MATYWPEIELHRLNRSVVFVSYRQQPEAILYPGRWSKEGCETNFNSTTTICKCDYLTHFAILLSARPLDLSPAPLKILSLQIIGYMWMLMEGVVLYVALVRVFVTYHARYIAAFTIASYGECVAPLARNCPTNAVILQVCLCSMLVVSQYLWALLGVRR